LLNFLTFEKNQRLIVSFDFLNKILEVLAMKGSSIRFTYVKDNQVPYKLQISRRDFFDFMNLLAKKFPDCNSTSKALCGIIPDMETLTIHQVALDTVDVPYIIYTVDGSDVQNILKIRRTNRIIWSYFMFFCDKAMTVHQR
jgi:hypothetical protein